MLEGLFQRKITTLNAALRAHLGKKLFARAYQNGGDIVVHGAATIGVEPQELLQEVARKYSIPVVERIVPIDLGILEQYGPQYHLRTMKKFGYIPHYEQGQWKALAINDESVAREVMPGMPRVYALASTIERALLESEELLEKRLLERQLQQREEHKEIARAVISRVVEEAEKYGASQVELLLTKDSPSYAFLTAQGERARGGLKPIIQESLKTLLLEAERGETSFMLTDGREVVVSLQRGGVFNVRLIQEVSDVPRLSIAKPQVSMKRDITVLIVDDNPTFAKVLERYVTRHGARVIHASDGERAMQFARERNPALVICDLHMPTMNGIDFLNQLRADSTTAMMPVLILTNDQDQEREVQCIDLGADAFIHKQDDPRLLWAHVKRVLSRERLRLAA